MDIRKNKVSVVVILGILLMTSIYTSCINAVNAERESLEKNQIDDALNGNRTVNSKVKDYWYDGKAEITSFKLTQARYGELREGTAVMIFVSEPFSKSSNTKADRQSPDNVSVLKLNSTKKFNTGIYPYSMMNSTFFPIENGNASLKIASSMQEWCGTTYLEMKNKDAFVFDLNSYFQGESFENKKLKKVTLEDDLWSLIRLNPELLPIGEHQVIPSMFYLQLMHKEVKAYKTVISKSQNAKGNNVYELKYPELERTVVIHFGNKFPNSILGWEESYFDGYGSGRKMLTTKAELMKSMKIDYWNKNSNQDKRLRDELSL